MLNTIIMFLRNWNLLTHLSKNPEKLSQVPKNIKQQYCSYIDYKSAYYNDFWISCDTEDWSNDDKVSFASQK